MQQHNHVCIDVSKMYLQYGKYTVFHLTTWTHNSTFLLLALESAGHMTYNLNAAKSVKYLALYCMLNTYNTSESSLTFQGI